MPETGLKRSPKFQKGALVQLVKDVVGMVPNVIPFQYNPEKLSHTLTPWNPFEVDQTQRGAQAPLGDGVRLRWPRSLISTSASRRL